MSFLVVAGITVPVAESSASLDTTEIGDKARAIDGTMRGSVIARKRTWTVRTGLLADATAATLRAALIATPTVTASGDWLGGSITVWPKLGSDTVAPATPLYRALNIVLEEA